MISPPLRRLGLLAVVGLILATPVYADYVGKLVWLVPLVLISGLLLWGLVLREQQGGPTAPNALAELLGQQLAHLIQWLAKLFAQLLVRGICVIHMAVRARPWLGSLPVAGLVVVVLLGYRLPFFDRHPSWQEFPHLTDSRLAVEEISRDKLWQRYHYRLPQALEEKTIWDFSDTYCTNVRNVHTIGTQVTGNEFEWDWWSHLLTWTGGNDAGHLSTESFPTGPRFYNRGYEYLRLNLGSEVGYFKVRTYGMDYTGRTEFYQFNYPATADDTLFLCYRSEF